MTGIDWENANMDKREAFSFTENRIKQICAEIAQREDADGCVLLSTCNRTELYLSGNAQLDPAKLLCQMANAEEALPLLKVRRGEQAERHLMRVSCGLQSQILGEDQIVSQVKRAYQIAHDAGTADAELSQLFRLAATAGKKSRTQVRLSAAPLSVAGQAVELITQQMGDLNGKRALVIGNGEMGRLACNLLHARGCDVTVTLRTYRHGVTIVPAGCHTIAYDDRMKKISDCDILISATTSPHFTVSYHDMIAMERYPALICDLSMPRDIDPSIHSISEIVCLDMDSMGGRESYADEQAHSQVEAIIEEEMNELFRWRSYREALPVMDELCQLTSERVVTGYDLSQLCSGEDHETIRKMEAAARLAAEKTARLLFSGLQGEWEDGALEACREAILRKAPQLRDRI